MILVWLLLGAMIGITMMAAINIAVGEGDEEYDVYGTSEDSMLQDRG